jgi:hypothetical protein
MVCPHQKPPTALLAWPPITFGLIARGLQAHRARAVHSKIERVVVGRTKNCRRAERVSVLLVEVARQRGRRRSTAIVPLVVIVPPVNPFPAVMLVTVPPLFASLAQVQDPLPLLFATCPLAQACGSW